MKNVPLCILMVLGSFLLCGQSSHAAGKSVAVHAPQDELTLIIKPNTPNPFFDETKIRFYISSPQHVTVNLYNILGVKIATLLREDLDGGDHEFTYKKPYDLPDGIYIYSVETPTVTRSKRMIIRK